jgi:hypothetical protein
MTQTKYTVKVRFKRPHKQQSRFSGFTKVPSTNILNESIFASPYFQHGRPTTMFRASASNHRQHKHLTVDLVIDMRSINMLSLSKSSESRTKNVLERFEKSVSQFSLLKKLRIKTNYTHCTYNFNAKVTDFFQNPLPADQQLGRQQLTRCGQPVKCYNN